METNLATGAQTFHERAPALWYGCSRNWPKCLRLAAAPGYTGTEKQIVLKHMNQMTALQQRYILSQALACFYLHLSNTYDFCCLETLHCTTVLLGSYLHQWWVNNQHFGDLLPLCHEDRYVSGLRNFNLTWLITWEYFNILLAVKP